VREHFDDRALVSIPEACRILGLGRSTAYELFDKEITTVKIGKRRLVVRSSIGEFVRRLTEPEVANG
jgi:excisionase family DNA binding protein